MSTTIVDRRGASDRATSDRNRFIRRNKKAVRRAVREKFTHNGDIQDPGKGGVDVPIPDADISEPGIHHGKGGTYEAVLPGNKKYTTGDRIPKDQQGTGQGCGGSPDGEGEDDFVFHLNEEEFLDILFEDLELPNLAETEFMDMEVTKPRRAGFTSEGPPSKRDMYATKGRQIKRQVAANSETNNEIIDKLTEKKDILQAYTEKGGTAKRKVSKPRSKAGKNFSGEFQPVNTQIAKLETRCKKLWKNVGNLLEEEDQQKIGEIDEALKQLYQSRRATPTMDPSDVKYRHHVHEPTPNTQAVMSCLMDVSGSMDEQKKYRAKGYMAYLYLFLTRKYDKVDVVFIRHTQEAAEVDQDQFFHGQETGGTIVSSGLEKTREILEERYPRGQWNRYVAQASDGDNFPDDNRNVDLELDLIVPEVNGFRYVEVESEFSNEMKHMLGRASNGSDLWELYEGKAAKYPKKMRLGHIKDDSDVGAVFRDHFSKRETVKNELKSSAAAMKPAV